MVDKKKREIIQNKLLASIMGLDSPKVAIALTEQELALLISMIKYPHAFNKFRQQMLEDLSQLYKEGFLNE